MGEIEENKSLMEILTPIMLEYDLKVLELEQIKFKIAHKIETYGPAISVSDMQIKNRGIEISEASISRQGEGFRGNGEFSGVYNAVMNEIKLLDKDIREASDSTLGKMLMCYKLSKIKDYVSILFYKNR